jgi:hypothetical protein
MSKHIMRDNRSPRCGVVIARRELLQGSGLSALQIHNTPA